MRSGYNFDTGIRTLRTRIININLLYFRALLELQTLKTAHANCRWEPIVR